MNEIIQKIFNGNSYIEHDIQCSDRLNFFKHKNRNIASYYIINQIDCRSFEDDKNLLKEELNKLEEEYSFSKEQYNYSLKQIIQNSFENTEESSQIDKNTSAIYFICLSDLEKLTYYKNLIFSIEESPNYFRRYVIPYTESQVSILANTISNFENISINEILSDIANNKDEYYKLLEGNNIGSEYEFVIRLFSKIPFLQYDFEPETSLQSLENKILSNVDSEVRKYHEAIKNKSITIDKILELESDFEYNDEMLEKEIDELLGDEK